MTIASTTTSQQFPRNGVTTQWSGNFKIFSAADVTVNDLDASTPPVVTPLVLGVDYTVQNVDIDTGFTVVTTVPGINGHTLDVRSNIAELQSTSIKNQGAFLPELHEEFFDKATRMLQDLFRKTYTFGIHGPDIESIPWSALPGPSARANTQLIFGSSGQPSVGVLLAAALTQGIFNGFLATSPPYAVTPAETVLSIVPVNLFLPAGYVDRYQTNTTPGTTLMVPGITNAIAVIKQMGGGQVVFQPGVDYFIGNYSTGNQPQGIFNITGAANIVFTGRARLVTNTTSTALPYIFYCKDCNQMTWDGLRFFDTGFVIGETYQGPIAVVATTSTANDSGGYTLRDVEVQNIVAPFAATTLGGGTGRVRGIHFQNLKVDTCTYGPSFQDQGDGAWGRISCNNVMRAYFPYGVSGHDITMDVWHDAGSQGSNGCIDIKRYLNDTSGIKLRVHFHGSVKQYGALVNFEIQATLGTLGITKFGAITPGTLYTDGFYANVPLTGGSSGTGATANLQSFGGAIVWAQICARGRGYLTTDSLSASNANMGGTGSGFAIAVAAVGGAIFGCDVDIDLSGAPFADPSVTGNNAFPVQFRSLTPGGATNTTTTDVWDGITLRGNFGDWATEQPGGTPQAINVVSTQTGTPGRLHLGGDQFGNFGGTPQLYPGFVVRTTADTDVYTKGGDLTAAPVFIDLNRYDGHAFALRVVIHGVLSWVDGANASNLEFILTGRKFGGGVPTLSTTTAGFSSTIGTATVPTFTPSGTGINVSFTNYNNAASYLKMSVQSLARLT